MQYVDPRVFEPKPFVTWGMGIILVLLVVVSGFLVFVTAVTSYNPEDEVVISTVMGSVCTMFGVVAWIVKNFIPWLVYTAKGKQVYSFHRSNREDSGLWYTYESPLFVCDVNGDMLRLGTDGIYRKTAEIPNKNDVIAQAPFLKLAVGGLLRWAREGHRSRAMFADGWWISTWDGVDVSGSACYEWNGKRSDSGPYRTKITEQAGVFLKRMEKFDHPRHPEERLVHRDHKVAALKKSLDEQAQELEHVQTHHTKLATAVAYALNMIDAEHDLKMVSPYAHHDRDYLEGALFLCMNDRSLEDWQDEAQDGDNQWLFELWFKSGPESHQKKIRDKHGVTKIDGELF
jgi:hypothetical protein